MIELVVACLLQIATISGTDSSTSTGTSPETSPTTETTTAAAPGGTGSWDDEG